MRVKRKIRTTVTLLLVFLFIFASTVNLTAWADQELVSEKLRAKNKTNILYKVKKGDCLWNVAGRFSVNMASLAELNGLNPEDMLREDETLIIPLERTILYKVSEGDTLWGIARKYSLDMGKLINLNKFSDTQLLITGQSILIPIEGYDREMTTGQTDSSIPLLKSWPVSGVVSSVFGLRNGRPHEGLDIAAEEGQPIKAVESGWVVFAAERGSYGNTVIINHGAGFRSLYAHASKIEVSTGDFVECNQSVARVGNTGRSTGPHLHLELLYRGRPLDPEKYLPNRI